MKRIKLLPIILAAAMLSGCSVMVYDETNPAPVPTAAPVRMAVVSENEDFSKAVEENALEQIQIGTSSDAEDVSYDVTLVYMPEPGTLSEAAGNEVVLTDAPEQVPDDVSTVAIDHDAAVWAAWDALYNYPSHCTPIRLLTLTEGGASLSRERFDIMLEEGKLQDKGSYIESQSEQPAGEWVAQRLADIPVGLLDTIYAETEELAIAAYNALRAAERNDSVEVICPVLTDTLVELMVEDHWSMGVCVGVTPKVEARAMLELAEELMETGRTRTIYLDPLVIYSDDVKALVDSGVTDVFDIMDALTN